MAARKEPVTVAEVNAELWRLVQRCNEILTEYHGAGGEYSEAKEAYEDKNAQEVFKAEGTVQQKKAIADKACKAEYLRFIRSETRYKYLKTVLDTTRDQLVALESIGSNLRQENDLQRYQNA